MNLFSDDVRTRHRGDIQSAATSPKSTPPTPPHSAHRQHCGGRCCYGTSKNNIKNNKSIAATQTGLPPHLAMFVAPTDNILKAGPLWRRRRRGRGAGAVIPSRLLPWTRLWAVAVLRDPRTAYLIFYKNQHDATHGSTTTERIFCISDGAQIVAHERPQPSSSSSAGATATVSATVSANDRYEISIIWDPARRIPALHLAACNADDADAWQLALTLMLPRRSLLSVMMDEIRRLRALTACDGSSSDIHAAGGGITTTPEKRENIDDKDDERSKSGTVVVVESEMLSLGQRRSSRDIVGPSRTRPKIAVELYGGDGSLSSGRDTARAEHVDAEAHADLGRTAMEAGGARARAAAANGEDSRQRRAAGLAWAHAHAQGESQMTLNGGMGMAMASAPPAVYRRGSSCPGVKCPCPEQK